MKRRLLLGMLAAGYGKAVVALVQLLLVPALALRWGLPLYGQWLMFASAPVFLGASDFGFGTTAAIRLTGEVARGELDQASVTFRSARRMIALLTALIALVAVAVVIALPDRLLAVRGAMDGASARVVLALLCGYGLLTLQAPLPLGVARAMGETARGIAIDATTQLAEGLAVLGVAIGGGGPLGAAIALIAVRAAGVLALLGYARRIAPWLRAGGRASRQRLRELWRPALAAMALPLSQAGYLQGTALAVGAAGGAALVPVYTSLRTLSRIGLQAVATVAIPLMPEYTAAHARGDARRAARIAGAVLAVSVAMGVGYALVIAGFGSPLLALWTRGAIAPPGAMIALTAIAAALALVWNPLSDLLLAINRHEAFAYAYLAAALACAGLAFVLVRRFGVTGAAAANLVLEAAMLVVVARLLWRQRAPLARRGLRTAPLVSGDRLGPA